MSGKKQPADNFKQEDVLQAVIIADSFNVRFAPLTNDSPRALLPLVNVPMIDYTLEFLCSSGIQEIIVFCSAHSHKIKEHLNQSKWMGPRSPCDIILTSSDDCVSAGDALREIYDQGLIRSDFVLVNADVVSNMNLQDALKLHKERRSKLKTTVMTMLFTAAEPKHHMRCLDEEIILALSKDNSRILHFQKLKDQHRFNFPLSMFQEQKEVTFHYDLLDSQISICSPSVPSLFKDEFDYQTREDFVRGILVNEEILGNTIHAHICTNNYATRVSNLQTFNAVSQDVMSRWSFPLVPDSNVTGKSDDQYIQGRHNTYCHKDVMLARGCVLEQNVVIGQGSKVGENSRIANSVIGKNCILGRAVNLRNAYILDNTIIEDNCQIQFSILGASCKVYNNVNIQEGSTLSSKVSLGPNVTLPPGTVLSSFKQTDEFGETYTYSQEIPRSMVGEKGEAYIFHPKTADEEDGDDDTEDQSADLAHDLWGLSIQSESEVESSDGEDEVDMLDASPPAEDSAMFYENVVGTLERDLEENIGLENLIVEINSLKHAYFMQIAEVIELLIKAVFEMPLSGDSSLDGTQYLVKFKQQMKKFLPLVKNYVRNSESQKICINSIEESCLGHKCIFNASTKVLHFLYDEDVLSEEILLRWHRTVPGESENIQERRNLRKQVEPLINWLEEAEEESEEDDSD